MDTVPILFCGRNLISISFLGSKMRHIPDGLTFKAQSGFSVSYWFQLLFTTLSFLFISALWRFSLLGSFKHDMFYIKFLFWEKKERKFHLCLVYYFTQNEKKKKFDQVADSGDHEDDNSNFSNSDSISLKFSSVYISLL